MVLQETLDISNFLAADQSNSHISVVSRILDLISATLAHHWSGRSPLHGQPPVGCSVCEEP